MARLAKTGPPFFRRSPDDALTPATIGATVASLYTAHAGHLTLAGAPASFSLDVGPLVEAALRNIADGFDGLVEPNLWSLTNQVLNEALSDGFREVATQYPEFLTQLRESAAVFSAFKAHQQKEVIAALLVDGDGKPRAFPAFKTEALKVSEDYNQTWLRTEYNTAKARARAAANWKNYQRDADLYPNLVYLRTRATQPDPAHLRYVGTVRPLSDPFWATHYPPSRWNCLCGVEQSDAHPTALPDEGVAPDPGLTDNPGQSGHLLAESHPYFSVDKKTARAIRREAKRLSDEQTG